MLCGGNNYYANDSVLFYCSTKIIYQTFFSAPNYLSYPPTPPPEIKKKKYSVKTLSFLHDFVCHVTTSHIQLLITLNNNNKYDNVHHRSYISRNKTFKLSKNHNSYLVAFRASLWPILPSPQLPNSQSMYMSDTISRTCCS